jgi:hypothetical protein
MKKAGTKPALFVFNPVVFPRQPPRALCLACGGPILLPGTNKARFPPGKSSSNIPTMFRIESQQYGNRESQLKLVSKHPSTVRFWVDPLFGKPEGAKKP